MSEDNKQSNRGFVTAAVSKDGSIASGAGVGAELVHRWNQFLKTLSIQDREDAKNYMLGALLSHTTEWEFKADLSVAIDCLDQFSGLNNKPTQPEDN